MTRRTTTRSPAPAARVPSPCASACCRAPPQALFGVKSAPCALMSPGCRRMWEEELEASSRRKFAWLAGIVAAAAALPAGWYWYSHRAAPVAEPAPTLAARRRPRPNRALPIRSPARRPTPAALPALNDSDQLAHDSLAGVIGRNPVDQFLIPQNIIRHVVVTVDNLSRKKLAVDLRPVKPTPGATVVATEGETTTLSAANYERYAPLMRVVASHRPEGAGRGVRAPLPAVPAVVRGPGVSGQVLQRPPGRGDRHAAADPGDHHPRGAGAAEGLL